jgi:transaldolase
VKRNPLLEIRVLGQSVWLDLLSRGMLVSGQLRMLIEQDGVSGETSNPAIFEKAIDGSHDYDKAIRSLVLQGKKAEEIYEALTVEDIQHSADLFRPLYDETDGRDGFISLELSPHLAYDIDGSISEAHRLWTILNRPNILLKVPATAKGLPVIKKLIYEGINVNITLLFSLDRYREVAEAYIAGLDARTEAGKPLEMVTSVASFFLSRIDVLVDSMLENVIQERDKRSEAANTLLGQTAISSAKAAYHIYREIFNSERFRRLSAKGARTQRLLWASTGTKNPAYSDVKYVEPLIGPDTVNTMPLETINAYRDHGDPANRLSDSVEEARLVLEKLQAFGIDLAAVTQQLEREGVKKFVEPYDKVISTINKRIDQCRSNKV